MAWMAAHLFVRSSDAHQVAGALARLLKQPDHRADLEQFDGLPEPVVVCPAHEGWVAVTGASAWFDDLTWVARELSAACETRTVSSELFGICYRLRLARCDRGQTEKLQHSPDEPWDEGQPPRATMPLYEDVEQLAYDGLRESGVAPALIAVGTRPFGIDGTLDLGTGATLSRGDNGVEQGELHVCLPALPADHPDAPVVPARLSQDFGLMVFEDRYVEGEPGEQSLERLLELEHAFGERVRHLAAEPDRVSLTVSYHAGPHQEPLNLLLSAHDRHTVASVTSAARIPWWQFWRYFGRIR